MIRLKKIRESGMTLVETTVVLVLVGVIFAVAMSFSTDAIRGNTEQGAKYTLLSDAQTGLNTVANDIRLSARADDTNRWQDEHAPLAPANKLSWTSGGGILVLAVAAQNSADNIIFEDVHNYVSAKNNYIYYVNDKTLYRRILAAPVAGNAIKTTCPSALSTPSCPGDKAIMENVSAFTIKYYDGADQVVVPSNARSVELSVKLAVQRYGKEIAVTYTTRMVFRNG